MPFHDDRAYSHTLQRHHTLTSSFLTSLAFHPSHASLASLSACGQLTVTDLAGSLPPAAASPFTPLPPSRALAATDTALYVAASDLGLLATDWALRPPTALLPDARVSALCPLPRGPLIAVLNRVWLAVLDPHRAEPYALRRADAHPTCLAATSRACFVAGFADGSVRQYDVRASAGPTRACTPARAPITAVAAAANGSFVLACDAARVARTVFMPAASAIAPCALPFVPRAAAFARGSFFVGGSDAKRPAAALVTMDFQGNLTGKTPASASSVYAIAVSNKGAVAAAGFSPQKRALGKARETVDVYVCPPVRSYSFEV